MNNDFLNFLINTKYKFTKLRINYKKHVKVIKLFVCANNYA